jgi:cytochrome c5
MIRMLRGAGGVAFLQAIVVGALSALSGPAFAQGDVERGRLKADTCMGCHGIPSYTNMYPTYPVPKLGGQHADYIVSALQAYKTGQRDHATMRAQASVLSTKDMEDIAAYFESLGPDVKAVSVATGAGGGQQQAAATKTGGASAAGATAMGKQTYTTTCATCHDAGVAGAPKISDPRAWKARIAQGKQTLYQHAMNGLGAMPPKGGDPSLSNAQVQAAVDYMVAQVGGGASKQPTAKQPAAAKQAKGPTSKTMQGAAKTAKQSQSGRATKGEAR